MANLSITAANVAAQSSAKTVDGIAGATIVAGDALYLDSADGRYKLADANGSGTTTIAGVALNGASAGQPVKVLTEGMLSLGAILTVGAIYVLSATAGKIAPAADLATGHVVNVIGVATTTSLLKVKLIASGATTP